MRRQCYELKKIRGMIIKMRRSVYDEKKGPRRGMVKKGMRGARSIRKEAGQEGR